LYAVGSQDLISAADSKLTQEGQMEVRTKKKKNNAKKITGFQVFWSFIFILFEFELFWHWRDLSFLSSLPLTILLRCWSPLPTLRSESSMVNIWFTSLEVRLL